MYNQQYVPRATKPKGAIEDVSSYKASPALFHSRIPVPSHAIDGPNNFGPDCFLPGAGDHLLLKSIPSHPRSYASWQSEGACYPDATWWCQQVGGGGFDPSVYRTNIENNFHNRKSSNMRAHGDGNLLCHQGQEMPGVAPHASGEKVGYISPALTGTHPTTPPLSEAPIVPPAEPPMVQ